jgi:hypothetical protein
MIRNVVLGRLRSSDDPDDAQRDRQQLEAGLAGILALEPPGLLDSHVGFDLGLRAGGWTFAITNDWQDAESYQRYDVDPEHNRHRQAIGAVCEQVARVQFEL